MFLLNNIRMLILLLSLSWSQINAQNQNTDDNDYNQRSQTTTSNESGLLSDIWTSLTTVNKTASCPGECVHAITSIFCDNVLEDISCGHLSRCCVSHSQYYHLFGDNLPPSSSSSSVVDETIPEDHTESSSPTSVTTTTTTTTTTLPPPTTTTTESFSVISNNHYTTSSGYNKINQPEHFPSLINSQSETSITTTTTTQTNEPLFYSSLDSFESGRNDNHNLNNHSMKQCPVRCSKINSFCIRSMHDAYCPYQDEECCLEQESTLDTMTKNFIKLVQQTVAMNQTKNIGSEFNAVINTGSTISAQPSTTTTTTTTTTTISPLPPCDGTCVVPLFHMLCDEIDHNQFCAHGYCCVNREPTTVAPQISVCDGTCLPVILSGMCTKPYELVLKTIDCGAGTICCAHGKNILDNNGNSQVFNNNENNNNRPEDSFVNQQRPQMMIPSQLPLGSISNYVPTATLGSNPNIPPRVPIPYPIRNNPSPPSPPPQPTPGNNKVHFRPPNLNENHHLKPITSNEENPAVMPPPSPTVIEPNYIPKQDIFPCPGKCINSMFKFTCLAGYSIYKNFKCSKGQICCASNAEIEKFEIFLHNTKIAQQQQQQQQVQQHNPQPIVPVQASVPKLNINPNPILEISPQPNKVPLPPPPPPAPPIINVNQHSVPSIKNENPLSTGGGLEPLPIVPLSVPMAIIPPPVISQVPQPHVCGVKGSKRTARVVGGSDSYPGEWCWQIALVNQHNKYICGGALIGKQWALTAAHCVTNYLRKNEPIIVRVGEYDLTRNNRLAQSQKVTTIYVHHNHNGQSLDNDIALLKLQSPVELNAYTCLVCLPTKNLERNFPKDNNKRCTVTGYGYQHESGPIALRIREALIPIVDNQECISRINSVTEKVFHLPASSFCAGGKGGNDACQGDGGSGLVCESDGFYELTGLVSWGFGCGRNGVPGVYVKVSSFVGWINQIVSTNAN